MAAIVRVVLRKTGQEIFNKCTTFNKEAAIRLKSSNTKPNKALKTKKKLTATRQRIDSVAESIAAKGFLRSTKSYSPQDNVAEKIERICSSLNVPIKSTYTFESLEEKFKVLEACFSNFNYGIPNSQIYELNTIGDITKFYSTPVDTTLPMDGYKKMELPPNLHIQHEYVRFVPETDTKFNGKSAFPKSSTLVTGLKYREKYPGHIAKRSWP